MQIQSINMNSQLVNLERVLNLPREIFTAEQDLAKKLLLMANTEKIQAQTEETRAAMLDMYV